MKVPGIFDGWVNVIHWIIEGLPLGNSYEIYIYVYIGGYFKFGFKLKLKLRQHKEYKKKKKKSLRKMAWNRIQAWTFFKWIVMAKSIQAKTFENEIILQRNSKSYMHEKVQSDESCGCLTKFKGHQEVFWIKFELEKTEMSANKKCIRYKSCFFAGALLNFFFICKVI